MSAMDRVTIIGFCIAMVVIVTCGAPIVGAIAVVLSTATVFKAVAIVIICGLAASIHYYWR